MQSVTALSPDAAQVARFTAALAAVWPEAQQPHARLGVAVSGGPDSVALLLLAAAAIPGRMEAATVDHQLRDASAAEAAAVAALCARLGVAHETLPVTVAPGNIQAEARTARYAALADWMERRGLSALATAHHADDQAETLLLRLNRGSGVAGLGGTRAKGKVPHTALPLVRPLLNWRRSELAAIIAATGTKVAHDPSNVDDRFDRARLRKSLAGAEWLDISAIAESARHLADADAALDWAARREWSERVTKEGLGLTYRPAAPKAIAIRVIVRIIAELDDIAPRGSAVARLFDSLLAGQPASIGNLVARPMPQGWSFSPAPKRRSLPKDTRQD